MRPLETEDLRMLKVQLKELRKEYILDQGVKHLRKNARFTLPVIALEKSDLDFSPILMGLPSFQIDLMNSKSKGRSPLIAWECYFRSPIL